jgi:hypothetical protein
LPLDKKAVKERVKVATFQRFNLWMGFVLIRKAIGASGAFVPVGVFELIRIKPSVDPLSYNRFPLLIFLGHL